MNRFFWKVGKEVFDQLSRPPLVWASAWEIAYYDSAREEYTACRKVAESVLAALGVEAPPRVAPSPRAERRRSNSTLPAAVPTRAEASDSRSDLAG